MKIKKNKKSQERVGDGTGSVGSISTDSFEVKALFKAFVHALQSEGYISERPLNQRNVANNNSAPASNEPFSSISGPNLTLWRLKGLKNKVSANNFVAALPALSAVAANGVAGQVIQQGTPSNSWSTADVATIRSEYQKLSDTVNELKNLLNALEIK